MLFSDEKLYKISEMLSSNQLKNLIAQGKWENCSKYLNNIIEELKKIVGEDGYHEHRDYNSKKDEKNYNSDDEVSGQTELEKACAILNVPENASFEQIKKAYKVLASIWHPDTGIVKEDKKMKEINWAYEVLKKYKKEKT